jgi:predicted ATP-binding protein involved in virulence
VRIDYLRITNFKRFASCEFRFDSQFNLIVGDNASGKTSALDALSIAVDGWFLGLRGAQAAGSIFPEQVHLDPQQFEDRVNFEKQFPARIEASGRVMGQDLTWSRELNSEKGRATTNRVKDLVIVAKEADRKVRAKEIVTIPLICSYGNERLWFESSHKKVAKKKSAAPELPSRFDGYRDCTEFEIQETDLLDWIRAEISAGQQRGAETIALGVMKQAIASCVEFATSIYYDERYKDLIVVTGQSDFQMFRNLSDGQRIMLTLIGDLAKRAIMLNPHLGRDVLLQTPGIVMIDELDLHLHPKWQRRIIRDLKRTFPQIQFVVTTHSPQLIGEALPQEIRVLDHGSVSIPSRSFGVDSSRVLEEVMHVSRRNVETGELLSRLAELIDKEDLEGARNALKLVEEKLGQGDPEVTGANTLIQLLESTQ